MVQSGKQLELTVACGLAKGETVHVLGRIQGGSDFLAWMDDLVLAGEDDLVDWDDEEDAVQWMMEGRDRPRSGKRTRLDESSESECSSHSPSAEVHLTACRGGGSNCLDRDEEPPKRAKSRPCRACTRRRRAGASQTQQEARGESIDCSQWDGSRRNNFVA